MYFLRKEFSDFMENNTNQLYNRIGTCNHREGRKSCGNNRLISISMFFGKNDSI